MPRHKESASRREVDHRAAHISGMPVFAPVADTNRKRVRPGSTSALTRAGIGRSRNPMWNIAVPVWELVVRGCVVYVFLLVLLRLTGKRQIGQLAPFDLVLLLVLSNAVQNSMNGGDNSLVGGLISAGTLVALNYGLGFATFKNKRLETLVEGRP